ncbi:MAG: hypothetical protein WAN86_19125 [Hyphomicrobiaceae bacterium]
MTRYLALGVCVLWAAAALAQTDRTRPSEGQVISSDRPSDGSKNSGEMPPEGDKTGAETRFLSGKWGAVAYTADGAFGAAYGFDSREEAERLAIDACRKESTNKDDCSRGVVTRQDSWFHVQFCRRGNDWTTRITTELTLPATNEGAAQFARTSKYGANNCNMVPNGLFHSGGLHTKR